MTTVVLTSSTSSWTVPAGVTSVQAECWGPGGAGWLAGGGGGAYAKKISVAVTPGTVMNAGTDFVIGLGGNLTRNGFNPSPSNDGTAATWFFSATTVKADYGRGGASTGTAATSIGVGGKASNSIGDVTNSGGSTDPGGFGGGISPDANAASGGGGAGSASGAGGQGLSNYTQPSGPAKSGDGGSSPQARSSG